MKKQITFLMILTFFLLASSLFAGGQPENASWFVSTATQGANGQYLDLDTPTSDTNGYDLMQIGSTLYKKKCSITIESTDATTNGEFYFVNESNPTMKYPYIINYIITQHTRYSSFTDNWTNSPKTLQNYVKDQEFSLIQANTNFVGTKTMQFETANFYLNYVQPSYGSLESGTYVSNLKITISGSSGDEIYNMTLQAKYMTNIDAGTGQFTDFYFNASPTDASYNIDLKNDTGKIQIADITFVHTTSPKKMTYGEHPYQVAVTASPIAWGSAESDDYLFIKQNIGSQKLSTSNSLGYTLTMEDTTSGQSASSVITGDDGLSLKMDAHQVTNNKEVSSNTYYNKFIFDGKVYLTLKNGTRDDLSSGRYSTTLYYYIICNI